MAYLLTINSINSPNLRMSYRNGFFFSDVWANHAVRIYHFPVRAISPTDHFNIWHGKAVIAQSVQRQAMGWIVEETGFDSRNEQEVFPFSTAFRLVLGPNQPPIQWFSGHFPRNKEAGGMKLTTHLHLVPRSRMVELYLHSPMCLIWSKVRVKLSLCLIN
jgi:hypothetical protein